MSTTDHPRPRRVAIKSLGLGSTALLLPSVFSAGACEERAPDSSCPPAKLSAEERSLRQRLGYLDQSESRTALCKDCNYYTPPVRSATCGGCTSLPGPIHPEGTCKLFRKKA